MIRHSGDFSAFDGAQMKKIAEAVERVENKRLYDTFSDRDRAKVAELELKVQGYHAETFRVNDNCYEVYAVIPAKVKLAEAEQSGAFKKLAFGYYSFQKESSLEMHDYPFDDGSIWRVTADEDGNQVLVKEVSDSDEDEVVRKSEASVKVATSATAFSFGNTNEDCSKLITVLFDSAEGFIGAMLEDPEVMKVIANKLSLMLNDEVDDKAASNGIANTGQLKKLKETLNAGLGTQVKDLKSLDDFIKEFVKSEAQQNQNQYNLLS